MFVNLIKVEEYPRDFFEAMFEDVFQAYEKIISASSIALGKEVGQSLCVSKFRVLLHTNTKSVMIGLS